MTDLLPAPATYAGETVDLGNGHTLSFYVDTDGVVWGADVMHPYPSGAACTGHGGVLFAGRLSDPGAMPGKQWTVLAADPLTLEPSILCRLCGDHGFIREGKWVPA